jgi:hypothetical protein
MTGFISILDQPKTKEEREFESWNKLYNTSSYNED